MSVWGGSVTGPLGQQGVKKAQQLARARLDSTHLRSTHFLSRPASLRTRSGTRKMLSPTSPPSGTVSMAPAVCGGAGEGCAQRVDGKGAPGEG